MIISRFNLSIYHHHVVGNPHVKYMCICIDIICSNVSMCAYVQE